MPLLGPIRLIGCSTPAQAFAAGSTAHEAMMVEYCQGDHQAEINLNGTTATSTTPNQPGTRSMAYGRSDWRSGGGLCGMWIWWKLECPEDHMKWS